MENITLEAQLTDDLLHVSDNGLLPDSETETRYCERSQKLYDDMCKGFEKQLTEDKLKDMFRALQYVTRQLMLERQDLGCAIGIHTAAALYKVLDNPHRYHEQLSRRYPPLSKLFEEEIALVKSVSPNFNFTD